MEAGTCVSAGAIGRKQGFAHDVRERLQDGRLVVSPVEDAELDVAQPGGIEGKENHTRQAQAGGRFGGNAQPEAPRKSNAASRSWA